MAPNGKTGVGLASMRERSHVVRRNVRHSVQWGRHHGFGDCADSGDIEYCVGLARNEGGATRHWWPPTIQNASQRNVRNSFNLEIDVARFMDDADVNIGV